MVYSTWNKWDLHIHTRASKVKCGDNEYFGTGNSFSYEDCIVFRDNIMKNGVKLVAITDHNYFDAIQFIKIKKLFKENYGNALPGVELKLFYYLNKLTKEVEYPLNNENSSLEESKPLHCIMIFNDDRVTDEGFYNHVQQLFETIYASTDICYIGDIVDIFLQNKYEFILIPHFVKHNDLEKTIKDKNNESPLTANMELKTKWIVGGFFSGLDGNVSKIKHSKIRAINYLKVNFDCDLPAIMTSDNHDYRNYCGDLSEYKALATFNGLKLCFSDFSQRVRYKKEDIAKNDVISAISITPDNNAKISDCIINLSPYLNCIIGGRSSGKSLLLALIGKVVKERTNNHVNQTQEAEYNKFLGRYKKYSDKTGIKLIRADGTDYDGRMDIYLQDSIIKRFEANDSSLLANDFKEEFSEHDADNIITIKESILNDIKSLIDLMDKLNIELKSLKSRGNIIPSINLQNISNHFIVYTDSASTICKKMQSEAKNLQALHSDLKDLKKKHKDTIKNHNDITVALQSLINIVDIIQAAAVISSNEFTELLNIVISVNEQLIEQYDESVQQYNVSRSGILKLVDDIINYLNTYAQLNNIVSKINELTEVEKSSENTVGNYKFVVKYSSKITSAVLIRLLNDFRVVLSQVETLEEFVATYVKEDKKWSHSRTSDTIKIRLEEEINKYIKKEYHIYEKDELINEMSEGRKASVFIDILLNKEQNQFPIIIDQPEDNMDNQDISKRLVESLRKRKNHRQIFVVTHNPNVLVNGDAENVIIASKNDATKEICYINSAIEYNDEFDMIQKICKLVEGGTNAFLKREKKYGLEVTDTKNYGGFDYD